MQTQGFFLLTELRILQAGRLEVGMPKRKTVRFYGRTIWLVLRLHVFLLQAIRKYDHFS